MVNKFQKKVLSNGLTVLFEKRDVSVTTVMLAAKYGSAYESLEEKGIAHFMEHLCFKGTDKRDVREIAEEVESVGGDLNAFTHEEVTAYHAKVPSEHWKVAMDVIFDVFFNATYPEEEVKKEAGVICEEIKMYHDNPRMHAIENLKKNLYKAPFGDFIAGSQENVLGFSRDLLFEKHQEIYVSGNSVLCVVGNNDFDEVVSMAESMKVREGNIEIDMPEIVIQNGNDREERTGVHQSNLALGFHFPTGSERSRYAAEVFSAILGDGMSSKLFTEVREKRGLVYGVKTDLDLGRNYGYMLIWAGTDKEKETEVLKVCLEEFEKMGEISEEELERAKVQVIGARHVENESSNDVAVNLVMEEIAGDATDYYNFEENIKAVTLDDIKDLAKLAKKYSSFTLGP